MLASLINLEFIALILFVIIVFYSSQGGLAFLSLIFITISVCEGALGLRVLVGFARSRGGDYIRGESLIQ